MITVITISTKPAVITTILITGSNVVAEGIVSAIALNDI